MNDEIFIQHRFSYTTDNGIVFNDAITLPQSDYDALTPEQIESMKQERFKNWKVQISTPPPEVAPEEQLQAIQDQIADLSVQEDQLAQLADTLQTQITQDMRAQGVAVQEVA